MTPKFATKLLFSALLTAACAVSAPITLGEAPLEEGGSTGGGSGPTGGSSQGGSSSGASGTAGTIILGGATGSGGTNGCTGLVCQIDPCAGRPKTSISGTVFDPAGRVPLYNVVVYVPSRPLDPLSTGAECQTCDGPFSGAPIAVALSGPDGRFVVNDAPSGADIPLVVQVGKWRRQITLPRVEACADNPTDPSETRLPRDTSEGHIPKIAIATGGSDALECLMRKIGVSDSEFGTQNASGRVHLYAGAGAPTSMADGTALADATDLWNDPGLLNGYDMMLLSCEGDDNVFDARYRDTPSQFTNIQAFADNGGRIFGSHWHHAWINQKYSTYPRVVNFSSGAHGFEPPEEAISVSVDMTFPKGDAFASWLVNVGASATRGTIDVKGAEHSVDTVVAGSAQRWIYGIDPERNDSDMLQYFSFNTPVGAAECGRMVFSDLHVSAGPSTDSGKDPFPDGCRTTELSPQEKALEFMIFDLSSCVQPDTDRPEPPPVVR